MKHLNDIPKRQSNAKLQKRASGNSTHLARDSEEPIHLVTQNILYYAVRWSTLGCYYAMLWWRRWWW